MSKVAYGLDDIEVYALGMAYCSVCVPKEMDREDIEELANLKSPTGVRSRWTLSDDTQFRSRGGAPPSPNPCPCSKNPETHIHYLMSC